MPKLRTLLPVAGSPTGQPRLAQPDPHRAPSPVLHTATSTSLICTVATLDAMQTWKGARVRSTTAPYLISWPTRRQTKGALWPPSAKRCPSEEIHKQVTIVKTGRAKVRSASILDQVTSLAILRCRCANSCMLINQADQGDNRVQLSSGQALNYGSVTRQKILKHAVAHTDWTHTTVPLPHNKQDAADSLQRPSLHGSW